MGSDPNPLDLAAALRAILREELEPLKELLLECATKPPGEPPLATGAEFDARFRVSSATRSRLVAAGMPSLRVGSSRRYSLETCKEWLELRSKERDANSQTQRGDVRLRSRQRAHDGPGQ